MDKAEFYLILKDILNESNSINDDYSLKDNPLFNSISLISLLEELATRNYYIDVIDILESANVSDIFDKLCKN